MHVYWPEGSGSLERRQQASGGVKAVNVDIYHDRHDNSCTRQCTALIEEKLRPIKKGLCARIHLHDVYCGMAWWSKSISHMTELTWLQAGCIPFLCSAVLTIHKSMHSDSCQIDTHRLFLGVKSLIQLSYELNAPIGSVQGAPWSLWLELPAPVRMPLVEKHIHGD